MEFCKLGSGISITVQAAACRIAPVFCSLRKDIFKYRVASIQFLRVSVASVRIADKLPHRPEMGFWCR